MISASIVRNVWHICRLPQRYQLRHIGAPNITSGAPAPPPRPLSHSTQRVPHAAIQARHVHTNTPQRAAPAVQQFRLSDIGEGIASVTVTEWHVRTGDWVREFDSVCEVQSDKASVTITSPYEGRVLRCYVGADDTVNVGECLVDIELSDQGDVSADDGARGAVEEASWPVVGDRSDSGQDVGESAPVQTFMRLPGEFGKVLATPAVRRLAIEQNIDLRTIEGSGKDGRVLKEDILHSIKHSISAGSSSTVQQTESSDRNVRKLSNLQQVMFKNMTKSLEVPHFHYFDDCDMTKVNEIRATRLADSQPITFMPLFIKACSLALTEFPLVNSSLILTNHSSSPELIDNADHNIGIAVDTPTGLLVPNIKHVQTLTILEIADELRRIQKQALLGKLSPKEFVGTTFTVSNIGSIGGTYACPIIVPPQLAIVALGRVREAVCLASGDDRVTRQSVLPMSWSADHRVVDGATIARASNMIKECLECPQTMLLRLR